MAILALVIVGAVACWLAVVFVLKAYLPYRRAASMIKELRGELQSAAKPNAASVILARVVSERSGPSLLVSALDQYRNALVDGRHPTGAEPYVANPTVAYVTLNSELVRHMPGLATAIGIVGSFLGLIGGLGEYQPGDPNSVGPLIDEVGKAFWGSMSAVFVAFLITAFDKGFTNALVVELHGLAGDIDRHFPVAPMEVQLLERFDGLSTQNNMLLGKVDDSNRYLVSLGESLNRSLEAVSKTIDSSTDRVLEEGLKPQADAIRDGIVSVLQAPLEAVRNAIASTAQTTNDGVQQLLTTVLTDFQQQLDKTFGGQIESITASNREAAATLQNAQSALTELVANIAATQKSGAEAVESSLRNTMDSVQRDQQALMAEVQRALGSVAQTLEETVQRSNQRGEESAAQFQELLAGAVAQMTAAMESAGRTASDNAEATLARMQGAMQSVTEEAQKSTADLLGAMQDLQRRIIETSEQSAGLVTDMRRLQASAFEAMNSGADNVRSAFGQFEGATGALSNAVRDFTPALTQLRSASSALDTAVSNFASIAETQSATQRTALETSRLLNGSVASAKDVAEALRSNAATIEELLGRVQAVSNAVQGHTAQISAAMQEGMQRFGTETTSQVERVFQLTTKELNNALMALSGAMGSMAVLLTEALKSDSPRDGR
jgi:putative membrane protein